MAGRIVILNGVPRAGKSSIIAALQARADSSWINLGVDTAISVLPEGLRPGIGLRPGGERPALEPVVQRLYAALFETIAAHSRQGFDVAVDLGIHDGYSQPLGIWSDAAARLAGLPVWLVGVRCPIEIIMARRNADPRAGHYEAGEGVPAPVRRWQEAVHQPGVYDLEVDTSVLSPAACGAAILRRLAEPALPDALERLRGAGR